MRSWLFLFTAIFLEVCGTVSMKLSDGFQRKGPAVAMAVFYVCSFAALTVAIKKIDLSIGYAAWSGLGTAAIAIAGVMFFKESIEPLKIVSLLMIVLGVAGLQLTKVKTISASEKEILTEVTRDSEHLATCTIESP
ncbi:MAG: multidrug efflux SMR transporter [Planctomycetales bacterium]|nr:multidrug efflux SMR transporter [Planctomycetales bacterium]